MRRFYAILVGVSLLCAVATSVIWWNYATLQWAYPRYRVETRKWWWHHFGDPFDTQRRHIAGYNPIDCSAQVRGDTTIPACIANASRQHRGFQLRADFCGIDSCGVTGVIGSPDGTVYEVSFDVWNHYVSVWRRRCPSPLQVATSDAWSGYTIACLPRATSETQLEIIRDDWGEQRKGQSR